MIYQFFGDQCREFFSSSQTPSWVWLPSLSSVIDYKTTFDFQGSIYFFLLLLPLIDTINHNLPPIMDQTLGILINEDKINITTKASGCFLILPKISKTRTETCLQLTRPLNIRTSLINALISFQNPFLRNTWHSLDHSKSNHTVLKSTELCIKL